VTTAAAVQWRKEVRELLPWWGATVVTMVACWVLMRPDAIPTDMFYQWAVALDRNGLLVVGLCAYAAGAVALGALSLGHEYTHHTLPALLAHPISRGRMLLVKLTVLAAMLAGLGVLALGAWGFDPLFAAPDERRAFLMLGALPLVCGLFLAPWLTMVGRGPLAGAVFTLALSSLLWAAGSYLGLPSILFWLATITLGAVGAVMTWRTFLRLEATGGSQADVDLSAWFGRSTAAAQARRTQHRVWLLIKKELRLQQATFAVSGIYVAVCLVVIMGRRFAPGAFSESPLYIATFMNTALIPMMTGAIASAEERRLGTADWHNLLPLAAWKQWTIKAGMALAIVFVLGVVLPELLTAIAREPGMRQGMEPATVMTICVVALYVSSLSTNAMRALLLTAPAIAAAGTAVVLLRFVLLSPQVGLALPAIRWAADALLPVVKVTRVDHYWWMRSGTGWMIVGFTLLLLWFAHLNHRTVDRSRGRLARQVGWLAAYVVAAWLQLGLVGQLFEAWIRARGR